MKFELTKPRSEDQSPRSLAFYGVSLTTKENEYCIQFLPWKSWDFGYQEIWYDGPIHMFGFGFFEFMWHYNMEM